MSPPEKIVDVDVEKDKEYHRALKQPLIVLLKKEKEIRERLTSSDHTYHNSMVAVSTLRRCQKLRIDWQFKDKFTSAQYRLFGFRNTDGFDKENPGNNIRQELIIDSASGGFVNEHLELEKEYFYTLFVEDVENRHRKCRFEEDRICFKISVPPDEESFRRELDDLFRKLKEDKKNVSAIHGSEGWLREMWGKAGLSTDFEELNNKYCQVIKNSKEYQDATKEKQVLMLEHANQFLEAGMRYFLDEQ